MNLRDMMAEDATAILDTDELGLDAIYTHKVDDNEVDIVVIMEPMAIASQIRGYSIQMDSTILITQVDFDPEVHDEISFVLDGTKWFVGPSEKIGPWTVITVSKNVIPTGTKTGFR